MNTSLPPLRRAFTLIELLIVVAIIAVLAAIALPNFLEAQVRAKVARAKADMRTVSTGLDLYRVDQNRYPDIFTRMTVITTPVSYLTQIPRDVFRLQQDSGSHSWRRGSYRYGAMPLDSTSRYVLASVGPDTDIDTYMNATADDDADSTTWEPDNQALRLYPGYSAELFSTGATVNSAQFLYIPYDPTNGTVTNGDIFRLSDHQVP